MGLSIINMQVTTILTLAVLTIVTGEPPVPSNRYLPSSFSSHKPISSISTSYGVPSLGGGNGFAANSVSSQYGVPSAEYGLPVVQQHISPYYAPQGYARSYDGQSEPANYNFQYEVEEPQYGNEFGHAETRQGDEARGKYYTLLPDGRKQTVEYTADVEGYKPRISYEQTNRYSNVAYSNGAYSQHRGNDGYQY